MLDFLKALEGWGIPLIAIIGLAFLFIIAQIIGAIMEACGKAAPVILNVKKHFKNKKLAELEKENQSKELNNTLKEVRDQQSQVKKLLAEVNMHYSTDCIAQRNYWMRMVEDKMKFVDDRAEIYDVSIQEIKECLAQNTANLSQASQQLGNTIKALEANTKMTEDMFIEQHRDRIISFADKVADPKYATSEEQFDRIFELYEEYEEFNKSHNRTNGKVNRNMGIITEAYNYRKKNRLFIEDLNQYKGLKDE